MVPVPPSAAGDGYDGGASAGSNLGPNNPDLAKAIRARAAIGQRDRVAVRGARRRGHRVRLRSRPADQPAYALPGHRVAEARAGSLRRPTALVEQHVQAPDLGFLGQPTVNVLQLNLALAAVRPVRSPRCRHISAVCGDVPGAR